jgi:putative hydrolase of the HAD superfamily
VAPPKACLIDVYETILTCDFDAHRDQISVIAGISAQHWDAGFGQIEAELNDGRISLLQGIEHILRRGGAPTSPDFVADIARQARDSLFDAARLFDDVIPFLELLRSRGITTAFVSNCGEDTRALLGHLGVSTLVDSLILSCEVHSSKPAAPIYQYALDELGVAAADAVFVDDQPGYCAGATALGIGAVQIARGPAARAPAPGTTVVRSLLDLEPIFA